MATRSQACNVSSNTVTLRHVLFCHSAFSSNSRNKDHDPQQTVTAERIVTLTSTLQEHFYAILLLAAVHFQMIQLIIMESFNAFLNYFSQ